VHGGQRADALSLHVSASHEVAGVLGGDRRDVDVLIGLDLRGVDREAVGEHQHRAWLQVILDRLAEELGLAGVWRQDYDHGRLRPCLGHRDRAKAISLHALDRLAAWVKADANVLPAVAEVERVCPALAPIADDGDGLAEARWTVGVVMDLHAPLLITTGP